MTHDKLFSVLNGADVGKRKKVAPTLGLALLSALVGTCGVFNNASAQEEGAAKAIEAVAKDANGKLQGHVLLVGCDVYDNQGLLPLLDYASSDMRNMRDALVELGFPPENIRTLESFSRSKDDRPTRAAIKEALKEITAKSEQDSVVFVAFSGHGVETAQRGSAFCPEDANVKENETNLDPESLILLDEVAKELRKDDAKFKVLLIDACRLPLGEKTTKGSGIKGLSDATGMIVLKSCEEGEASWEDSEIKGGVFTHFFVEALKGAGNPGERAGLSFQNICDYATGKTQRFIWERKNRKQTPTYLFSGCMDFWVREPVVRGPIVDPPPGDPAKEQYEQGRALVWGLNGATVDVGRGVALLEEAKSKGSLDAQAMLANLYFDGCDVFPVNYAKAFELAAEPAQRGNPYGQFVLAKCYYYGFGVQKNRESADEWSAKAFQGFVKLSEAGDTLAWNELACCYSGGFGTPRDYKKSAEYFEKAAVAGSAVSRANLCTHYSSGLGVEKDEAKAVKLAREAEAQGSTYALFHLGDFYLEGIGVEKNYTEAAKYYRKALEKNYAHAAARLGMLYENGWGVEKNVDEARKLYEQAAQGHSAPGYLSLGLLYYNGVGVEQDDKEAFDLFEKAAELELVDAIWFLAKCYEEGRGTSKSPKRAKEWRDEKLRILKNDVEGGNVYAMNLLGDEYYSGNIAGEPDYEEAVKWYKKASDAGVAAAIYNLGNCYYLGAGVERDYAEAVKRFRRASELGYLFATSSLGDCYYFGNGVEQDYSEAVRLYRQAADENLAEAMNSLGNCYDLGRGVEENKEEAFRWYQKAAELNHYWGLYNVAIYYRDGSGVEKNVPKAVEYFERAAKLKNADAIHCLAGIYWNGDEGVEKNPMKTLRYLQEAADLGSLIALYDLGVVYAEGIVGEKDPKKAMELWQKAAELGSTQAMNQIAQVYREKEEYEETAKWYQKAADAGDAEAMNRLGVLYGSGNLGGEPNLEKARECYQKALEMGSEWAKLNLAKIAVASPATRAEGRKTLEALAAGAQDEDIRKAAKDALSELNDEPPVTESSESSESSGALKSGANVRRIQGLLNARSAREGAGSAREVDAPSEAPTTEVRGRKATIVDYVKQKERRATR